MPFFSPAVGRGPAGRRCSTTSTPRCGTWCCGDTLGPLGATARAPVAPPLYRRTPDRHAVRVVQARDRRRARLPRRPGHRRAPRHRPPLLARRRAQPRPRWSSPSAGSSRSSATTCSSAAARRGPRAGPRPRASSSSATATSGPRVEAVDRRARRRRLGDASPAASPTPSWSTSTAGPGSSPRASAREGWGMTLTEAAACGTPAVATRIAGHADAVRRRASAASSPTTTAEPRPTPSSPVLADAGACATGCAGGRPRHARPRSRWEATATRDPRRPLADEAAPPARPDPGAAARR